MSATRRPSSARPTGTRLCVDRCCVSDDDFRKKYYTAKIEVVFNCKKARFEGDKSAKSSHKDLPDILRHEYAVIGNIYENPELLK